MSNAGQIGLGIVGGIAGFYLGGPSGAAYGLQLGLAVGTVVSPTQLPGTFGPRLSDNRTTTSQLGAPIVELWGTDAVAGTVIWLGDVVEHATTEEVGGKGGPEGENTTFSYTQSIAVGLCRGPKAGIRRIWENGKLVYDVRGKQPNESLDDYTLRVAESQSVYGATFTVYSGDEDQLPDPTIELKEGLGNVPAYRGLMYIVYNDRLLRDDQGQRHPNFKFEVVDVPTGSALMMLTRGNPDTYPVIPCYSLLCAGGDFENIALTAINLRTEGLIEFRGLAGVGLRAVVTAPQQSLGGGVPLYDRAAYTADAGQTWTPNDLTPSFGDDYPYPVPVAVACNPAGRFVISAIREGAAIESIVPTIRYSDDGEFWLTANLLGSGLDAPGAENLGLSVLAYVHGEFMLAGGGSPGFDGGIFTSPDGEHWTKRYVVNETIAPVSFAYAAGLYVLAGAAALQTSLNGHAWADPITPSGYGTDNLVVIYGDGTWLKVSEDGVAITTDPTGTWPAPIMPLVPTVSEVRAAVYDGTQFVLVGGGPVGTAILTSPSGAPGTWTLRSLGLVPSPTGSFETVISHVITL